MALLAGQNPSSSGWKDYFAQTREPPKPEFIKPFLDNVPLHGRILDFGCGSRRHSLAFVRDRHDVTVDMLDMQLSDSFPVQSKPAGIGEMHTMRFEDWKAPAQAYDAIWAAHSLFFIPEPQWEPVFAQLAKALKPNGVLELTFVEDGSPAQSLHFYGISESRLRELLNSNDLECNDFNRRSDMKYGKSGIIVPTFVVRALKRK